MNRNFHLKTFPWLSVILSGILYGVSFSPFINVHLDFCAWFCWIPLFLALKNPALKPSHYALAVYLAFLIGNLIATWWLFVSASLLFVILAELIGFSVITGLVFLPFYVMQKKLGWQRALWLLPLLWTFWEWLLTQQEWHSTLTFFYYTQADYYWLIQFADLTGAWGITFWLVLTNVVLTKVIERWQQNQQTYSKLLIYLTTTLSLTLSAPLVYSLYAFDYWQQKLVTAESVKVALLQPNQIRTEAPRDSIAILENNVISSTNLLIKYQPDLLIWPEGVIEEDFSKDRLLSNYLFKVIQNWGTPLLFGFLEETQHGKKNLLYNSAILVTPQLADYALQQQQTTELPFKIYHKQNLLPFAEYVPFSATFPQFQDLTLTFDGKKTYILPGIDEGFVFAFLAKNNTLHRIGIRICYEVMYLTNTVKMISNGAEMLALISNDGRFGNTPESYRMKAYSQLLAIVTRKTVARAANTGLTFFANPLGEIYSSIPWWQNNNLTSSVLLNKELSFYVQHPDIFPKICGGLLLILVSLLTIKTSKTKNKKFFTPAR